MSTVAKNPDSGTSVPADKVLSVQNQAMFLLTIADGALLFLLPIYAQHLGASALLIGCLVGVYFVFPLLLRPALGHAIDARGRKSLAVLGGITYLVAMVLFIFARQLPFLFVARIVEGLSAVLLRLVMSAVVTDVTDDTNRSSGFGALESAIARGAVLGAVWAFVVLIFTGLDTGWTIMFVCYALMAASGVLLIVRYLPETGQIIQRTSLPAWRSVLSRHVLALLPIVLLTSLGAGMVTPILLIYMQAHFTVNIVTLGLAYIPAALVLGYLPTWAGHLIDLTGRKQPLLLATLLVIPVTIFMPFAPALWVIVLLWVIEASCASTTAPAQESLIASMSGTHRQGRTFALYGTAVALGTAAGPILGGWLYDSYGHAAPFLVNGGLLFIAALLIAVLIREPAAQRLSLWHAVRLTTRRMLSPQQTGPTPEFMARVPRVQAVVVALALACLVAAADAGLLLLLVWLGSGRVTTAISLVWGELGLWALGALIFGAAYDILPGKSVAWKAAIIGLGLGLIDDVVAVPHMLPALRQLSSVYAGQQGQVIALIETPLESVVGWLIIGYFFGLIAEFLGSWLAARRNDTAADAQP